MSAQTSYGFKTTAGAAGGIVDLAPYEINTFLNEENTGVMKFGYGVVRGTNANGCKLPTSASTADKFLGITTNNRSTEFDMEGNIHVLNKAAVGVMRYGRIYARVAANLTIAAGDKVYLIVSGTDAGKFTNDSSDGIEISGVFNGPADAHAIAPVTLFNAPAPVDVTIPAATATKLGGVKVGTGLDVSADGTISVHQG